ncbi:MAG: DUF4412 domain-containing protein [Bacteroidota bacterium]
MTTRLMRRTIAVGAASLLAVSLFAQGMYTESTTSGGPMGDRTIQSKSYMMPRMFRHESGDGKVMIVRLDKELVYWVDPADKTYSESTFKEIEESMKKAGAQMDKRMAEMEEKMKDMPPEQRAMMEKMMGGMMGGKSKDAKVEVTGPGEKKSIGGYNCAKYTVSSDGKEMMTLWVSKDVRGFESLKKDWEEYSRRMAQLTPGVGKAMAEAFKKLDGYPIQTEMMGVTTVVTKVEKHTTPPSQFEVPAGYTKTDSPLKKMEKKDE